ncbi:envelope glycoprotein B [Columbid alphaherpesvirus 1]|uniref:Envelope glycoprotein B n=1 Tax=Columbid alphaherpesvirus 1 TaxID=93386 RepID=A0A0S2GYI1_9ALPH|nr:envelope glycoprotein B [Columbid alphaherpesvirus 1]ALO02511.1 envelope glycoprotein B [Columbid alphaherpesvirus 1]ARD71352.1 envelope glycoprotein B [Columbid alphaherpesvirus 1]
MQGRDLHHLRDRLPSDGRPGSGSGREDRSGHDSYLRLGRVFSLVRGAPAAGAGHRRKSQGGGGERGARKCERLSSRAFVPMSPDVYVPTTSPCVQLVAFVVMHLLLGSLPMVSSQTAAPAAAAAAAAPAAAAAAVAANGSQANPQAGPKVTTTELMKNIQVTGDEATFYVCPPPTGATVMRLEPPRPCPEAHKGKRWTEGIAVIFKENISPYKFKAKLYYKNVIQTTTWAGTTYRTITNRYTERVPVLIEEITDLIDRKGKCSSGAKYLKNNVWVEAFDMDTYAREVDLRPSRFSTAESKAWHTTNDTYTVFGSVWIYRTSTSVNCIVEEIDARSLYPYDSFALSNGDVVLMSPFFGYAPPEAAKENMGYAADRFRQLDNYFQFDLDTKQKNKLPSKRNFLTTTQFTVGWDWEAKKERVCSMSKWQTVDEMLRANYDGGRMRFMSKSLSATFIANSTQFNPDRIILGQCVRKEAEEEIKKIFATKYNETHVLSGTVEYYLTVGGFVVAYQPIMSRTLASMYIKELIRDNRTDVALDLLSRQSNPSGSSGGGAAGKRKKRAATVDANKIDENTMIRTTSSAQYAMLQFTYDHIQGHVNDMFSRIAVAWCELQNKERVLWSEALKISPSSISSAHVGTRVSARLLGDVLSVSSCIKVRPEDVVLENSMKVPTSTSSCYSRPLVLFSYEAKQEKVTGQLGEDNELIPTRDAIEQCVANHRRYFLFGDKYAYFEDYVFIKMVDLSEVQMLSTYVELNLTMLEDREILPLEVYTKEEIRDAGVLDYAEVAKRNALHELKFYDIDKVIEVDTQYAFMQGLTEFFNGLGQAGQAIGKVVVGAAGAVVSTVNGLASFMSNPFGALAVGLIVVAAVVAAFLAYRYMHKLRSNPMKALYPMTTQELKKKAKGEDGEGAGEEGGEEEEEFDENKLQMARDMIRYMALISAEERQQKKLRKKKHGTSAFLADHLTGLRLRNKSPKYERLRTDGSEDDPDDNYKDVIV